MTDATPGPLPPGLTALGHAGLWLYEHRAVGTALLPSGDLGLRRRPTLAVCALLTLGRLSAG